MSPTRPVNVADYGRMKAIGGGVERPNTSLPDVEVPEGETPIIESAIPPRP
jgi:hypothetical protein